MKASNR